MGTASMWESLFARRCAAIVLSVPGSIVEWKDWVESYLDALCKEIRFVGEKSETKKLNTIYIGGGTPTTLTAEQLERLLTCIDETFSRRDLLDIPWKRGARTALPKRS